MDVDGAVAVVTVTIGGYVFRETIWTNVVDTHFVAVRM